LSHAIADITAALDLDDLGLHDLRRTGATGIAALGVAPFIASKVLAHKDGGGAPSRPVITISTPTPRKSATR
jgi:integrase